MKRNMKRKSSVITPPPQMDEGQGGDIVSMLNEDQRKEALIKLVRKGAPSVPPKDQEEREGKKRLKYTLRITSGLMERINRAASNRDIMTPVNTWVTDAITLALKKEGF